MHALCVHTDGQRRAVQHSPVPQRDDATGEFAALRCLVVRPRQAEVRDLQDALVVDQQVAGLQVAVQHLQLSVLDQMLGYACRPVVPALTATPCSQQPRSACEQSAGIRRLMYCSCTHVALVAEGQPSEQLLHVALDLRQQQRGWVIPANTAPCSIASLMHCICTKF